MEALFKQKLIDLRSNTAPVTFCEALFPDGTFFHPSFSNSLKLQVKERREDNGFSEKRHLIESLERFVEEKEVVEVGEKAEITLKKASEWSYLNEDYLLNEELREIVLKRKNKVEVIFVTETLRSFDEFKSELSGNFIDQLLCGFPMKTAELFERMILAMKLKPEEVILYPSEFEGVSLFEDIVKLTKEYRPLVIITLGAKATSAVLKTKDRLAQVHGQFFNRKLVDSYEVQVVPLFHPNIIETNQNMKKTAWIDMQKVMKYLKKLP